MNHRKLPKIPKFIVIGSVIIIVIALVASLSGTSNPSWSAHTNKITPVDAKTVRVDFTVKNNGKKAGTPSCTITVKNTKGSGVAIRKSPWTIKPGESDPDTTTITVTNESALLAQDATYDCR